MPFKDSPDGQTHSMNDGCGMPEHNQKTMTPTIDDMVRDLSKAPNVIAKSQLRNALELAKAIGAKEALEEFRDYFITRKQL